MKKQCTQKCLIKQIELKIETQSCKIKVGQNLNEERKNKFLEKLKNITNR